MAKRFTDTFKWQRPWFRNLPPPYRELWLYILDMCDHAGIWYVDFQMAELVLNCKIEKAVAETHFGKQVHKIDDSRWFIKDFIPFQYGKLTESHFHRAIKATLKNFNLKVKDTLSIPYRKGTYGTRKEREREIKDVKVLGDGTEGVATDAKRKEWFGKIWLAYPKHRRHGRDVAVGRFLKSVVSLEDAKRCARGLDRYLKSVSDQQYIMRASKWFAEWEDHTDDFERDSQRVSGETPQPRADNPSAGSREQAVDANHVLRILADSKALGHKSPIDNPDNPRS